MIAQHWDEALENLDDFNKTMLRNGRGYINLAEEVDSNGDPTEKKATRIIAVDTRSDEIVRIFYSIDDAAKAFKRRATHIKGVIYGYTKSFCGGRYKLYREVKFWDAYPGREIVCKSEPDLDFPEHVPPKSGRNKRHVVYVFTPDGKFIAKYSGVQEASDATGAPPCGIMKVCRGMHRTSKKLKFSYTNKPAVYEYDPDNNGSK